jgi:hypothetical protein
MTHPNQLTDEIPELDAAAVPDYDEIEAGFHATIEERKNLDRDIQRAFRRDEIIAPSSVVGSAEGPMLFPGFGDSKRGVLLNAVARAALTGEGMADVESQTRESLDAE